MLKKVCLIVSLAIFSPLCTASTDGITLPSTVFSKNNLIVSSESSGQLLFILDKGLNFKKGQTIAEVESHHDKKKINLLHSQHSNVKNKVSELERIIKGYVALAKKNVISEEQRSRVSNEYTSFLIELNQVEQQIIQLEQILDKKIIKAPFDGVILERNAQVFEIVQSGTALMRIDDPKSRYLQVFVPWDIYNILDLQSAHVMDNSDHVKLELDYTVREVKSRSNVVELGYKIIGGNTLPGQPLKITIMKKTDKSRISL